VTVRRMPRILAVPGLVIAIAIVSSGCAARGRIATPDEMARLGQANGLSASGQIALSGPGGRFRTRIVIGVARPGSLRLEIPAGSGLRFLLVTNGGRLRADLPQDDATYEGPATSQVMDALFGVAFDPKDLVAAILGDSPEGLAAAWRFDRGQPAQVSMNDVHGKKLTLNFEESDLQTPDSRAFTFGAARSRSITLAEMAERLGLKR